MIFFYRKDEQNQMKWQLICLNFTKKCEDFCDSRTCQNCFYGKLKKNDKGYSEALFSHYILRSKSGTFVLLMFEEEES